MGEPKRYHQVTSPVHAADGMTVLYGPGELHEPGSLPAGVPYAEVVADEAGVAASPVHAQADERDAAVAARKSELERIQTERSQPAAAAEEPAPEPPQDRPQAAQPAKAAPQQAAKPAQSGKA